MTQEKIKIYGYGFNANGQPISLFKSEKPLKSEDEAHFKRWSKIIQDLPLPTNCELSKAPLPQWVNYQAPYQKGIILLFSRMKHLSEPQTYHQLPKSYIRKTSNRNNAVNLDNHPVSHYNFQPVITIGKRDIMGLYEDPEKGRKDLRDTPAPDPRFKFFDSSIWHRYVPIYKDVDEGDDIITAADFSSFTNRLVSVLQLMSRYHNGNLYTTNAARSALELQLRLLKESFIERFGNMGHYKAVTPFKFHSETRMEEKANALVNEFYFGFLKGKKRIKWNFLMVDDYANSPISNFLYLNNEGEARSSNLSDQQGDDKFTCQWTKRELILELLEELKDGIQIDFPLAKDSKDPLPEGETEYPSDASAKTNIIKTCREYIETRHYDVLLLDYLLGRINDTEYREFGHQFLQFLNKDAENEGRYNRGPFGRFWIFPISSFPFAMQDKFKQLGIGNFNLWRHLAEGSDPISTPQLFRFGLLSFLKNQISEVLLPPLELEHVVKKFAYTYNQQLWTGVLAAQINEILLKIKLLHANEDKSEFAETMTSNLSNKYFDLLSNIKNLANAFQNEIDFHENETSFMQIYAPWMKLQKEFSDSIYSGVIGHIDIIFERMGIFPNIRRVEKIIAEFIPKKSTSLNLDSQILFVLPEKLASAKQIESLSLRNNKLESLPDFLTGLQHLVSLDLTGNPISTVPPILFRLRDQLSYLSLAGTKLNLAEPVADNSDKVKALLDQAKQLGFNNWIASIETALDNGLLLDSITFFLQDPLAKLSSEQKNELSLHRGTWSNHRRSYRLNLISLKDYTEMLAKKLEAVRELLNKIKSSRNKSNTHS